MILYLLILAIPSGLFLLPAGMVYFYSLRTKFFYLPFMNFLKQIRSLLAGLGIILLMFVFVSIIDIALSVLSYRFYSTAAFLVIFGVGGVFAATFAYTYAIKLAPEKNELARWSLIIMMILTGLFFFFFLALLEGGEYEAAFKAFGATLALGSLLFVKGKVEL